MPRVTGHLRIVLEKPGPRVDPPLRVKVEYGEDVEKQILTSLKSEIEETMSKILRFRPDVDLVPPESLERDPLKKGKLVEKSYEES